ncbi:hypothetical protein FDP41_012565 [Naegleria fowleri]|uniref:Uncharacterized protein n=1 Tax=Naegleria fowleri TaxID=5763 RepID=A0A6A5C731_NAEFO|nr:uncharacterized protein FDP41_012565 [Naegleria fowleri]KAF0981305.1 hypothetical protein FDP41_012565 [Naegleria fowleri]CAG4711364.1 unnamed protein product [Naegleria fowleri]
MIPHHHHHKEITSITDTIDFFSEQSPFYSESIQIAKQAYKNKPQALVFPQPPQHQLIQDLSPLREVSSWFDDEHDLNEPFKLDRKNAPSPVNQQLSIHEDQVFLDEGNCDFDMDFFDTTPVQQPSTKKAKYQHESSSSQQYSNSLMEVASSTSSTQPVKPSSSSQDNLLSILLREQQKQGAEITELKQMVHNLQAQIMMHPMYQQQFMLYQQHQQQQYQLYLQQQNNNSQQNHQ